MIKLHKYLRTSSYIKTILVFTIVHIFLGIGFSLLCKSLGILETAAQNERMKELYESMPTAIILLVAGIGIPWIETLLAQAVFIEVNLLIFRKYKRRLCIALILASILFGFMHRYNIYYFISGLIAGLILAYAYIIGKKRKEPAILLPFIIHAVSNIFLITLSMFKI